MTSVADDELLLVRDTAASIAQRCRDGGSDHRDCWKRLVDAGFTELRSADEDGPAADVAVTATVVRELARAVCGAPLVGHLLANELMRLAGAEPSTDGPMTILLDPSWTSVADGHAWDASLADVAVYADEDQLWSVPLGDRTDTIDPTRPSASPVGDREPLGTLPAAARRQFDAFARTVLTADLLGAAWAIFDDALAYVKDRVQFGVPVGSFQAVQHLCSEAYVRLQVVESTLEFAIRALVDGADATAVARTSLVAKSFAADSCVEVVEAAVQAFGGIAITWEHHAHRHLRRVLLDRQTFGDSDFLDPALLEDETSDDPTPADTSDDDDAPELARFRAEFRAWLETNTITQRSDEEHPRFLQRWHQVLFAGGWVGLSWPREFGGRGVSGVYEVVVNSEIGRVGAPDAPRIGYMGRALLTWGSEEQRQAYLPGLLRGDDYWCQGFSEPGAGSDLANVSTRAVREGDTYRINGQKVWTSYGEFADYCLLLARTGNDPDQPKHKGISAFVLPMNTPGVEVRAIRAITGQSEFCEIFLDDVVIDAAQRIGEEGDGWPIAMMTVAYERGAADVGYLSKFGAALGELRQLLAERQDDATVRRELGRLTKLYLVLSEQVEHTLDQRQRTESVPGPEMSVDKVLMTLVDQSLHASAMRLLGSSALAGPERGEWLEHYFYSRAASIYGGSQQIQLNIIAQRLLGLPR